VTPGSKRRRVWLDGDGIEIGRVTQRVTNAFAVVQLSRRGSARGRNQIVAVEKLRDALAGISAAST
jgi:hypothetical protein